jgi:PAS domain-containing protein
MNSGLLVSEATRDVLLTTALQASEARYQDLFENVNDIVFTLNSMGDFTSRTPLGKSHRVFEGGIARAEFRGLVSRRRFPVSSRGN